MTDETTTSEQMPRPEAERAQETAAPEPEPKPEPVDETPEPEPRPEPVDEPEPETEAAAVPEPEPVDEPEPETEPEAAAVPAVPSPAIFARRHVAPDRTPSFGRVAEDGVVFVRTADGERQVGSYPRATPEEALAYFGRKYDELLASVELLYQRVTQTDISAKEAREQYDRLREQTHEPNVVGDLAALEAKMDDIAAAVEGKRAAEAEQRAAAREEGRAYREHLVVEAERIAAQPESSVQWKSSTARMRELLDAWKAHQRSGPRLDRSTETALWHRFSAARNAFDRARRVHFAQLDSQQVAAKATKERLVAQAERLATSRDWAATAGAFKQLMDEWRRAGRAGRQDDDALWLRFKAAQDAFFTAKDEVVAKEEAAYRANLQVKERLLAEAERILPVTDLDAAKASLRSIQDRWERAGKVPRGDLERTEKALRRVEQAVRDAEGRRWSSSNPEAAARAQSLADQLQSAVQALRAELATAERSGDPSQAARAREALESREALLAQVKAGLDEFGG